MTLTARLYIGIISCAGSAVLIWNLLNFHPDDAIRFACYLFLAIMASGLKVRLPAITGTMSVNFFFILLGIVELTPAETVVMGCASVAVQCVWRARTKAKAVQVLFNISANAIAVATAELVYQGGQDLGIGTNLPVLVMITASVYFVVNTLSIAGVIAVTELRAVTRVWRECYFWAFPYYLAGASISWVVSLWNRSFSWTSSLIAFPAIYFVYRSYRLYLDKLEDEKKHVEEMAGLHLRTIEALAMAIEARDFSTHDHLQRVRVYAAEIAKELNLSPSDLDALRAAALLHDIGKLAVPQHVISKPGRLTPEEYEKVKIHTVVGAEILERVQFPYPVAPIVRAHHEAWDGNGYPDGLAGEQIPIGARILAAVDCLDALTSDRQYRRAVPMSQAIRTIQSESGKMFDPRVVEVLVRNYERLEPLAQAELQEKSKLSKDVRVTKGSGPAGGFEESELLGYVHTIPALSSIAAARQEAQVLFELTRDLGNSLSLDETLSVVAARLKRMIPFNALAIYIKRDSILVPVCVLGEDYRYFSSLEIPMGEGLSGWAAANRSPVINGDPANEATHLRPGIANTKLKSALCVPLDGISGLVGVLSVYKAEEQGFARDHLRILLAISSKISLAIENALKYRQAENSATTDYLTALPNARSLFLRLDGELSRCKRENSTLAVLVGDLNGFKQLNDTLGHLQGNRMLRAVATALQNSCRQYDYVARMGGDEFVLLFPGLKTEALEETIARMETIVGDAARECGCDWLSISIGAALYPEDGTDADQLLAQADRRMYKAKQARKPELPPPPPADERFWQPTVQ